MQKVMDGDIFYGRAQTCAISALAKHESRYIYKVKAFS